MNYLRNLSLVFVGLLSTQSIFAGVDLTQPYISEETFASFPVDSTGFSGAGGWVRDGAEMEVTYKFTCMDPSKSPLELDKKIFQTLNAGNYEKFRKMVKCKACEAVSMGLGPLNVPWDKVSHAVRQNLGYLPLTIEDDRMMPKTPMSVAKLSYGADLMDDIYFDTDDYLLGNSNYALRARKRWDSAQTTEAPSMRRILVGLKQTPPVDASSGLKAALKIDDRFDMPSAKMISSFATEVPTGLRAYEHTAWDISGAQTKTMKTDPIPSVVRLYRALQAQGSLPDVQDKKQVLQMKPKTFLRSLRLRFHYGTIPLNHLYEMESLGRQMVSVVLERAQKVDQSKLSATDLNSIKTIIQLAKQLNNEDQFLQASGFSEKDNLLRDESIFPHPGYYVEAHNLDTARLTPARKIIEHLAQHFMNLGHLVERNAHLLSSGADKGKEPSWLRKTLILSNQKLQSATPVPAAALPYYQLLQEKVAEGDTVASVIESLNQIAETQKKTGDKDFENFKAIDEKSFEKIQQSLDWQVMDEGGRQIEAVANAMRSQWFLAYHQAVVKNAFDSFNLFIDTADLVGMFKAEPMEVDEFDPANPKAPPVRKVVNFNELTNNHVITENSVQKSLIGTYLSNDVQLELGYEKQYQTALENNPPPEKVAAVKWIQNEILRFQKNASKLKAVQMANFIDKQDASKAGCSKFQWKPTDLPKGESSIKKLQELESIK